MLKDQKNKQLHEDSAQLAWLVPFLLLRSSYQCRLYFSFALIFSEASGAIRTVASLTREKDAVGECLLRERTAEGSARVTGSFLSTARLVLEVARRPASSCQEDSGLLQRSLRSLPVPRLLRHRSRLLFVSRCPDPLSSAHADSFSRLCPDIGSRWIADGTLALNQFFTTLVSPC